MCLCGCMLVCLCAGVLVYWCVCVLVCLCACVFVCLCAYVLGLMYKAFLCIFVMYRKEHSWLQDKAVKSGPPPSEYVEVPVFIPFQF